jgi:chromosome segregation ATPase
MFKRNESEEDIEKEGEKELTHDVGSMVEFEGWEKGSSDSDDEEYRGYERGEELLEETDMLHAFGQLRNKLDEFEKAREELKAQIEATEKLLPGLNREKERLEKSISHKREKADEIGNLIPSLEKKRENMQKDIVRKQEERDLLEKEIHQGQEKIIEINNLLPNLDRNRMNLQNYMERDQREISRIEQEVNLITYSQRYGTKLIKLR